MPRAARRVGRIDECERTLVGLEAETDAALDLFVTAAEQAYGFYSTMEKVDSQLASAERLQRAENDLQLNESVVIAEKLEGEITAAEKLAGGAAISETQEDWAESFENARAVLDRMGLLLKKAKAGNAAGEAMEARAAVLSFRREAAALKKKLGNLKATLESRKNPAHSKVKLARARLARLKAGVGETFSKIARTRLKKRIAEAKEQMTLFMHKAHAGKIFVDQKHVTLSAGQHSTRLPFSEAVGFALSDMAPQLQRSLSKVARGGAHLVGRYEYADGSRVLRIGERTVSGDAIIYRERSFRI